MPKPTKHNTFYYCSMPQCEGYRYSVVHYFPCCRERLTKWVEALPIFESFSPEKLKNMHLCFQHFRPSDYVHAESKAINRTAVPSLNLMDLSQLDLCKQAAKEETKGGKKITNALVALMEMEKQQRLSEDTGSKAVKRKLCDRVQFDNIESLEEELLQHDPDDQQEQNSDIENENLHYVVDEIGEIEAQHLLHENDDEADDFMDLAETSDIMTTQNSSKNTTILLMHAGFSNDSMQISTDWLRSMCNCSECEQNPKLRQLGEAGRPKSMQYTDTDLNVQWNDEHKSTYHLKDLFKKYIQRNTVLWDAEILLKSEYAHTLDLNNLISEYNEIYLKACFECLQQVGFVTINNFCSNVKSQKKQLQIQLLLNCLFPNAPKSAFVQENQLDFRNGKKLQTSCTFDSFEHAIHIYNMETPRNQCAPVRLVDGFKAVNDLKHAKPGSYKHLCWKKLKFKYNGHNGTSYLYQTTIFKVENGEVTEIHFDRDRLETSNEPQDLMKAVENFETFLNKKNPPFCFNFNEDTVLIMNSKRICSVIGGAEDRLQAHYLANKYYVTRLQEFGLE